MPDSDEVPIADAIEQQREATPMEPEESADAPPGDVPLEAPDADWQDQHEEVMEDPEERTDD